MLTHFSSQDLSRTKLITYACQRAFVRQMLVHAQILSFYIFTTFVCTLDWIAGTLWPVIVNNLEIPGIVVTAVLTTEGTLLTEVSLYMYLSQRIWTSRSKFFRKYGPLGTEINGPTLGPNISPTK